VVVASDLSLPLLRSLKQTLAESYNDKRCYVMQLNAEELLFEDQQFDLVVGAAILHHLFDPEKALSETCRVLKPGGIALFFEPFEIGHQFISLALKELISRNSCLELGSTIENQIPEDVLGVFRALCHDFEVRKGSNKTDPIFLSIDDKWLFTRSWLERVRIRCGFDRLTIYDLYPMEPLVTNQVNSFLRLKIGKSLSPLPLWVLDYLREMDSHFSADARIELITEGGIVLQKAG
jgi:SAM-dependent methyltransferase